MAQTNLESVDLTASNSNENEKAKEESKEDETPPELTPPNGTENKGAFHIGALANNVGKTLGSTFKKGLATASSMGNTISQSIKTRAAATNESETASHDSLYDGSAEEMRKYAAPKLVHNPGNINRLQKRVLVTGGAGFIGSHLIDALMERGYDVICADNLFSGQKCNLYKWFGNPNFEFMRHDVCNPLYVEVDEIYHLACPASPVFYQNNPIKTIKVCICLKCNNKITSLIYPAIYVKSTAMLNFVHVFTASILLIQLLGTKFSQFDSQKKNVHFAVTRNVS